MNPESCSGKAEALCVKERGELKYSIPSWTQRVLCLDDLIQWVSKDWVNDVCWRFQCMWRGSGRFCFSGGWGRFGVSPNLGFDVQARLCRLALRQLSPMSLLMAPSLTSSSHFPKKTLIISVTYLRLLWDCSWCDTFSNQIIKGKSRTCKKGTKQGSWQLTTLTIFLGWGLQASSCSPVWSNSGLMFDSDQIGRRAEHQASDRLSDLSLPSLFFPLTRLATDWQGYALPGWQQSL